MAESKVEYVLKDLAIEKVYKIYSLETKEVCVPSNDYYSRRGDFQLEFINVLESYGDEFDTLEEAERSLEKEYPKDRNYIIFLTYNFKK